MISLINKYSYFIEEDLHKIQLIENQYCYYFDFKVKPKIKKPKLIKNTTLYVVKVKAYNRIYYFYSERINTIQLQQFDNQKAWRIIFK